MGRDHQGRKSLRAAVIKGVIGYAAAFTFSVIIIYILYGTLPDNEYGWTHLEPNIVEFFSRYWLVPSQ
jgi:hypothetical protein